MRFGDCNLDLDKRELVRNGVVVDLEPQVFDVLAHLIAHRDRVVPKNELLDVIWGSRFVSESALTSRIKSARRAIGDNGRDQLLIKTIHRKGYRFIAHVYSAESGTAGEEVATEIAGMLSSGKGGTWIIEGGAGRGRAELLERIHTAAERAGTPVGRSSCAADGLLRFRCVLGALDALVLHLGPDAPSLPRAIQEELHRGGEDGAPTSRARMFLAVREAVVGVCSTRPALIILDDVEFADPETRVLITHIQRLTGVHPLALIVAHRPGLSWFPDATRIELQSVEPGWTHLSAPSELVEPLQAVALGGDTFDLVEFQAATGLDDEASDRTLQLALTAGLIVPTDEGTGFFRFADAATGEKMREQIPPHRSSALHSETAVRLAAAGAAPDRVGRHLLAGDRPAEVVPYAVAAAQLAAAAGFHRDVLFWTEQGLDHAVGAERLELLSIRGGSLTAAGNPAAVPIYREALAIALEAEVPGLRARLARAAMLCSDFATAAEALDGLETAGGPGDAAILLAQAMFSYLRGDLDTTARLVEQARPLALAPDTPSQLLDVIVLQGLVAHDRGEWFDRVRTELRSTQTNPALASIIFDNHLCVAEYLLYGPTPHDEIVHMGTDLRDLARDSGARRAEAFASCVIGEAHYLAGHLEAARSNLEDAVRVYQELTADAGAAHSAQRLAEVELALGNQEEAERLARQALRQGRWSTMSRHVLPRIYGTLLRAAPDVAAAVAIAAEAAEIRDDPTSCVFCQVMIEVPLAVVWARAGEPERAQEHLMRARASAMMWRGSAWKAAITEADATIASSRGEQSKAGQLLQEAALLFEEAEQPLDAARCRNGPSGISTASP